MTAHPFTWRSSSSPPQSSSSLFDCSRYMWSTLYVITRTLSDTNAVSVSLLCCVCVSGCDVRFCVGLFVCFFYSVMPLMKDTSSTIGVENTLDTPTSTMLALGATRGWGGGNSLSEENSRTHTHTHTEVCCSSRRVFVASRTGYL